MSDVLIIGGGLMGQLSARELNAAGAEVTLLERGSLGQESSWAGGGILSPLYPWRYPRALNELVTWSQARYPALVAELLEATGIDAQWTQSGLLILDDAQIAAALAWAQDLGVNVQAVGAKEIRDLEPATNTRAGSGVWLPEVAQVRNPRLLQALQQDLVRRGVRILPNSEVQQLRVEAGRIGGVRCSHGEIHATKVVVACGAWSASVLSELGLRLAVAPVRGQMILLHARPGQLQRIILHQDHYAIPRRDGRILVGSTLEHVGFDKNITEQGHQNLLAAARELMPTLAEAPLEKHWAGLRPGSPEGVPFIGEHPQIQGLYVNAGHYRNGVVTAPASARLLSDILLGRKQILNSTPYAVVAASASVEIPG